MTENNNLRRIFWGVGCLTSATLIFEFTAVRLLSALMLHSYTFLAISLALLGMSAGAVMVYMNSDKLLKIPVQKILMYASLLTAFSILPSFMFLYGWGGMFNYKESVDFISTWLIIQALIVSFILSAPFFFTSAALSLVFKTWSERIGRLYWADFVGAALGCWLFYWGLTFLNAFQVLWLVIAVLLLGSYLFLADSDRDFYKQRLIPVIISAFVMVVVGQSSIFNPKSANLAFAEWSPSSYVTVRTAEVKDQVYATWRPPFPESGMWSDWDEMYLRIDEDALTPLIKAERDLSNLDPIKDSFGALPYYLITPEKVAIIGSGGGADIITALLFDTPKITAIEINSLIIKATKEKFSDYIGGIYNRPEVAVVNAEARNYLYNSRDKYDLIISTLVDSWTANASGAFATSETYLYTKEAISQFLSSLNTGGVIAITRWVPDMPKLLLIAEAGLRDHGITQPEKNLLLFRYQGLVNLFISNQPFTVEDVEKITQVAKEKGFGLIFPSTDYKTVSEYINFISQQPLFVNQGVPPLIVDDRPFFFNHSSGLNIFSFRHQQMSPLLLVAMFWVIVILSIILVGWPLVKKWQTFKNDSPLIIKKIGIGAIYFILSGTAFFLLEIILVQKLMLFLGKPEYTLIAVISSILLFGGIGSLMVDKVKLSVALIFCLMLPAVALIYLWLPRYLLDNVIGWGNTFRLALSALSAAPLGLFMGMFFPVGIRLFAVNKADLTPWFWGVSSAASVVGSLLAVVLPLNFGLSISWWIGVICYLSAAVLGFIYFKITIQNKPQHT